MSKAKSAITSVAAIGLFFAVSTTAQTPLGTGFTYQCRLKNAGSPANGLHDLRFRLYDASVGGVQVGAAVCADNVSVSEGLFTVPLDFGDHFAGQERFLEVEVRADTGLDCTDPSAFALLTPRQPVTAAPYALWSRQAASADSAATAASLGLPYSASESIAGGVVLSISNSSPDEGSDGIAAVTTSLGATALFGRAAGPESSAVEGVAEGDDSVGVRGVANALTGSSIGVSGTVIGSQGQGVFGYAFSATGPTYGVYGRNNSSEGLGVFGWATASTGAAHGVLGRSNSVSGRGVFGHGSSSTGINYGVYGQSDSPTGYGVFGTNSGSGIAGGFSNSNYTTNICGANFGVSTNGPVIGASFQGSGTGLTNVPWSVITGAPTTLLSLPCFRSIDTSANAFRITNTNGAGATAIAGTAAGSTGVGVRGSISGFGGSAAYGVWGDTSGQNGAGVYGDAHPGGIGYSDGVRGHTDSAFGAGLHGIGRNKGGEFEVEGTGNDSSLLRCVYAHSDVAVGSVRCVHADTSNHLGIAVYANIDNNQSGTDERFGVWANCPAVGSGYRYAIYGHGDFGVTGNKNFRIDHPLDPLNKYLLHYSNESPQPQLQYFGNVVTGEDGYAWVRLPEYFETINKDLKYQLTVVDESDDFVLAKVTKEVSGNQFQIRTSKPGVKVSWMVAGTRNDAYCRHNPPATEIEKGEDLRGAYQHPELYGQPPELGVNYNAAHERPASATPLDGAPR